MALTLQDFITKYTNIPNVGDTDINKGQCVGLIEVWTDNLGLPHTWGNAKDLLANADTTKFQVIKNDPNNTNQFPVPGDVMTWDSTWGNGNGHTGVIVTANGNNFDCFEQNNPTGHTPIINHHNNYSGVLGWLHPLITIPTTSTYKGIDTANIDSVKVCIDIWDAVVNQHQYVAAADVNAICTDLGLPAGSNKDAIIAAITKLQNDKITAETNNAQLTKQIPDLEGQISTLTNEVTSLTQQLETAKQQQNDPQTGLLYKDLYTQAESDLIKKQQDYTTLTQTTNRQIAQLQLTSATTMDIKKLWGIALQRSFKLS